MTEQFSQEYIAYILKAKGLQDKALKEWPSEGDWVWFDGKAHLVRALDKQRARVLVGAAWYKVEDVTWLPTLFQLIRVIEGANEGRTHWRIFRMRDGRRKYTMTVHTFGKHEHNANSDDLLLAAAQLAVRAVEEK